MAMLVGNCFPSEISGCLRTKKINQNLCNFERETVDAESVNLFLI